MKPDCECPNCGAEIIIFYLEKYELIECWNCHRELEFIGDGLINPESEQTT